MQRCFSNAKKGPILQVFPNRLSHMKMLRYWKTPRANLVAIYEGWYWTWVSRLGGRPPDLGLEKMTDGTGPGKLH